MTNMYPSFEGGVKGNDLDFVRDIKDVHIIYDYDATNAETGEPEKWRYEAWFYNEDRFVYAIHGGPMEGRNNYQHCAWQCIRPGELWQCNWLEETGTICSLVYDIPNGKVTTLIAFSQGHWDRADQAKGDKRNVEDFKRWVPLADIGRQTDRLMLSEQGMVVEKLFGKGDLEDFDPKAPTIRPDGP